MPALSTETEPRASGMLGEHSTDGTMSATCITHSKANILPLIIQSSLLLSEGLILLAYFTEPKQVDQLEQRSGRHLLKSA